MKYVKEKGKIPLKNMAQTKRNTKKSRKTQRRTKKPKSYIAPYKVIIFCLLVITVCMTLLLVTNIMPSKTSPILQANSEQENSSQAANANQKSSNEKQNQTAAKTTVQKENQTSASKSSVNDSDSKESQKVASKTEQKTSAVKENQTSDKNASQSSAKNAAQDSSQNSTQNAAKNSGNAQTSQNSNQSSAQSAAKNTSGTPAESAAKSGQSASQTAKAASSAAVIVQNPDIQKKNSFNFPQAKAGAQILFVFDDGGQNVNQLKKFLELNFPITIAVLPRLAHSKECADLIRKSGNELMLHQPMQAVNPNVNPGPGAITPNMSEEDIIATLFQNITEIGPIAGFNNHEGSAITADAEKMEVIMRVASQEGIYFLDSRTNVETKVPYVAGEMGYSYYERNIFLDNNFQENKFKDNENTRKNFLTELNKGLVIANKNGSVIMIGHIWSADLLPALLWEVYPELVQKGYTFSTVSKSKAKKG